MGSSICMQVRAAFWHPAFYIKPFRCLFANSTYDATSTTYALSLKSPRFMLQARVWKLDGGPIQS